MKSIILLVLQFFIFSAYAKAPKEFIDVSKINPTIAVELRYFSEWNFVGRVIDGYKANKCYLTNEAANALSKVENELQLQGMSLLVFDCYRPERAVTEFLEWTKKPEDHKMQMVFYPDEPKEKLVERGYIADKSSHSRGSTIDLTILKVAKAPEPVKKLDQLRFQEEDVDCRHQKKPTSTKQLDMGTIFDCFSVLANTSNSEVS